DLANAQKRFAARNGQQFGDARIGGGSVNFFVGVAEFDFVITLENAEKRFAVDGLVEQAGKFGGVEVTGLERERLSGSVAEAFEFDDAAVGRKRKARSGFAFVVNDFGKEHFRGGSERARGHLLGVAHELVEVNFRRRDERADAAAAFDEALAFKEDERVARGHEADVMRTREVTLRGNGVAGLQLAGIDALANDALNALISRHSA